MHLDEGQVQRVVDGVLAGTVESAVRAHLDACADCRSRVNAGDAETRQLNALLETLDVPVPPVTAASIVRRASAARPRLAWRRAAALLLVAGSAAVAWAAPGSPVPRLVRQVLGIGARQRPPDPETPVPPAPAVVPGISVSPGNALRIEFSDSYRTGVATLSMTDGDEVQVRVTRGTASFSSGQDRLLITGSADSVRFEIAIPRAAPLVEVLVGERRIFAKQGDRVRTDARADAGDRYVLPLSPP